MANLEAKAKDTAWGSVIAFEGREYVKYEWRAVPAGYEEQATKNDLLETRPVQAQTQMPKGTADEHVEEIMKESRTRRTRKPKTESEE